ncbi:MAG: right-handed parallel beta-helix repeat-containing protein [Bacteroidota bacterium]
MRSYSTSSGDQIIGEDADLYVGSAINFKVGGTRELTYNPSTCSFELANNVRMFPDGFSTFFTYSEYQIETDVIPTLTSLGKTADAQKWKDIVTYNHTLKKNAVLKENLSFDALAQINDQLTIERTISQSITSDITWTAAMNTTIGFEVFSVGTQVKVSVELGGSKSTTSTTAGTTTRTVSYTLADNDVGDKFTVNVKEDKVYQTPVFELVAGTTSCPWEPNTRHRSQPSLISKDGLVATNVSANTSAVFELQLGNLSPTEETMDYEISVVTGTNPDGSIVKIDGQNIISTPIRYTIPYGESRKVLLTIARGPIAYNYSGITIELKNACERNDSLFTKELAFNVSFIEPCSTVDISFPLQDWVVTPASNNVVNITLNEYDNTDADLELIRVQYRRIGGDGAWINITDVLKADLGSVFKIVQWNTGLLKDGEYEIRAITQCVNTSLAAGVSTIVKGSIQRLPPELVGKPEPADGVWDPGDEISITFNEDIECNKVFQADILSNNTIGLYDATTNLLVNATISCVGNKLIIVPNINPKDFENRTFRVKVSGTESSATIGIQDKYGNKMVSNILWEFAVNQNSLEWVGTDIIETNVVLHPFSVKRQIRNRGGTIMQFRMEDLPFWLTISPSTGTLNPGQTADVTFTFQQDMLIGDYLTTINMVGSQGKEPLKIDYRVRCQPPVWEVQNINEFSGSMNMVVKLNIFGQQSMDPSDIIVAKINNQIRGVGNISYVRSLDQWLAFITIYGNDVDARKDIVFNVWDGSACREYSEVLEAISYNDGDLIGSPINPQNLHVINLVQKCIPLAKGWNWVSVNLDLLDNSVGNVLKSLQHKNNNYLIKDDDTFSNYYTQNNLGWQGTLDTLRPKKRYMIYVDQRDTLCLKGKPYIVSQSPIPIVREWNWIGYVPQTGMTVTQALAGLTPLNGDIIKDQTRFAQYVAGIGWVGNLSFLEAPKGYLLKISNPGTLVFPTTSGNSFTGSISGDGKTPLLSFGGAEILDKTAAFDFGKFSSTMNSVGVVHGITIDPNDELRAYIKGELRGVIKSGVYSLSNESLFFMTIYGDAVEKIVFKLFKADRKKEYDLVGDMNFETDALKGLVEKPFVLTLALSSLAATQITIENQVITQPALAFNPVSVPNSLGSSATCGNFSFNTILPTGTTTPPPACTLPTGFQNNMTGTIKVVYNERSNFASVNDRLIFTDPASSNLVVGCGTSTTVGGQIIFNFTVKGGNSSTPIPIDVSYYSYNLQTTFVLKSGVNYLKDVVLGNIITPQVLDFSPLKVIMDANGVITTTVNDPNWTGKYPIDVFAMNCPGRSDGTANFYFQRLKVVDCVELTASNNAPFCAGNTLNLSSSQGGTTYAWTGPNSFSSTERKPTLIQASSLATGVYTVTATHSSGCISTATTAVTVYATPAATASSNSPICAGTTLSLSGSGGSSYAWIGSNFTSSTQNPSITNTTTAVSGIYTLTVTNANACSAIVTTLVTVNANPTATASISTPVVCSGTTLNLTSNGGSAYAWAGPNLFTSTVQNPTLANATTLASGVYTVTVNNASLCTGTATVSVTVNPIVNSPTAQANTLIVVGGSVSLTATGCSGVNDALKWYKSSDNTLASMPVSPTTTSNYYATCEQTLLGITCISTKSADVTVTVLSPSIPVATAATICATSSGTLTATGCSGSTGTFVLKWYQNADNLLVTMPVSPTSTTDYYATCEQTFNSVTAISGKSNVVTLTVLSPTVPLAKGGVSYNANAISLTATGCTGTLKWYQTTDNVSVTMPVLPSVSTQYYAKCEQTANAVTCLSAKSNDVSVRVATRIFVDITKIAAPVQNGSSWASAYGNLQTALAATTANVEVWVAKGTYKPTSTITRTVYFDIPTNVTIYGGFAGTENELSERNFRTNVSILSGDIGTPNLDTDNSYHVVVFNGSSSTTVLDGFTVTGGYANFDPRRIFNTTSVPLTTVTIETGGGIAVQNGGSPVIINCTISNNAAVSGGGLYAGDASKPSMIACKFMGNQAGFGSGIYLQSSGNIQISNTLISGNKGIGSIYNNYSNPTLSNCTFGGNGGYNGGIFNSNSQPVVKNSIIWGNSSPFTDTQSIITNSIIQGGYLGTGNLSYNPQFVNPVAEGTSPTIDGDYHLKAASLAIDRGDNGSISLTALDLGGNLRRFAGGSVDMGAYEFQGSATATLVISIQTGNWESNSTWDIGRVPQLGDYVIIDQNHTVTVNSTGIAKSLEYRGTGTLKLNPVSGSLSIGF